MSKETLTMLHCSQCDIQTGHRVKQTNEYPDRTEVLFECVECVETDWQTKYKRAKLKRRIIYVEIINWDEVFLGSNPVGIKHADKKCKKGLRPRPDRATNSLKIGRGDHRTLNIVATCKKCWREENESL